MTLGALYTPRGKALETASQVLGCRLPMAVNIAYGCRNCCSYPCYIPYIEPGQMRFPKRPPVEQVAEQLKKMEEANEKPEGVFLCFATDPFLKENWEATTKVLELLEGKDIKTATLSKTGISSYKTVRHGMTLVSLDDSFSMNYEKNAVLPNSRLTLLKNADANGEYTWVSMEPYPTPEKHRQNITHLLEKVSFVDFIIFGKWNYDAKTGTKEAKEFYQDAVAEFRDF